jgi:ABC-type transport system involved in multi-copper enzyme maturation permease subunit
MIALLARSARQARYVLIGASVMLFGFQLILVGQAGEIERTQAFSRLADLVPGFLQRGLGSRAMLLATFRGTVAFGYFHPVVCVLIAGVAMYLTTEPAYEIESGLVDLELARAVPRHRLLTRSALLAALAVGALLALMFLGTSAGGRLFDAEAFGLPSAGVRLRLLFNLAGVAACFAGLGLLAASLFSRWTTAFTTCVFTAIVLYLVDFLAIGWPPMRALSWVSPFHYYPALNIVAGDPVRGRDLVVLYGAGLLLAAGAYWRFQRRDL